MLTLVRRVGPYLRSPPFLLRRPSFLSDFSPSRQQHQAGELVNERANVSSFTCKLNNHLCVPRWRKLRSQRRNNIGWRLCTNSDLMKGVNYRPVHVQITVSAPVCVNLRAR